MRGDDAARGDDALRQPEGRRQRAAGEQALAAAQRQRVHKQPERVDQVVRQQRLQQAGAAPDVQVAAGLAFDFGHLNGDVPAQDPGRLPGGGGEGA